MLETLEYLAHQTKVWLELTTLLIPGENDSAERIEAMTKWVREKLGPHVPMHFTAFHPDYKMTDKPHTTPETLTRARAIAIRERHSLRVHGQRARRRRRYDVCHACGASLVVRDWYELRSFRLSSEGRCLACGETYAGVFDGKPGRQGRRRMPVVLGAA